MGGRGSSSKRTGYTTPLMMPPKEAEPEEAKPTEPEATEPDKRTYHYFYDKMKDPWHYEGDGKHQKEWFKANSNVDEIIDDVTSTDRMAVRDWASGHFMGGQQYRGWDNMSDGDKEWTQRYDDMLDKSILKKGVTVVRRTDAQLIMGKGVYTASLEQLQSMRGKYVTAKGNMSTGAAAQGLTIGDDDKRHEFRIKIPAGSKGAGMWIGDSRINPYWGADQREFMTNRDISLKVGKTTYDKKRDVYITELTFAGALAHDYGTSGRV